MTNPEPPPEEAVPPPTGYPSMEAYDADRATNPISEPEVDAPSQSTEAARLEAHRVWRVAGEGDHREAWEAGYLAAYLAAARPEPPVEGALEEARAFEFQYPSDRYDFSLCVVDGCDLDGWVRTRGDHLNWRCIHHFQEELIAAARSGHDELREALVDAALGYHAAMDHDFFGPTLPLAECTDARCTRFRRALSPEAVSND